MTGRPGPAPPHDLVLRGGRIVGQGGVERADLAIRAGRIEAWLDAGEPAASLATLDVAGKLLLPGLVDAHVHLREPGLTWKEDFASGTRAAIAGGVTTVLCMPTDDPWTTTPAAFLDKRALAEGRIFADVGLQVAVARQRQDLAELVRLGAASCEIFTADVPEGFLHATASDLRAAIAAVHGAGGIVAVSPGEQSILAAELARLVPGRSSPEDFVRTRPGHAEAQGIARAILAAADAGAPIHIRQSNSREGMAVFRRLKTLAEVTIETSPQGLMFTAADYPRLGVEAKASPPFRHSADRAAVRDALADGTVDIVVTDHAPHTAGEKHAHGDDFTAVPGGFPGLQTLLLTLLSLVDEGLIGLPDVVRLAASRPAEIFGLGTCKGSLRPGLDADILVLDPQRSTRISRADQLSKSSFSPFEGLVAPYRLERVFLRGRDVFGAAGVGAEATGRFVAPQR